MAGDNEDDLRRDGPVAVAAGIEKNVDGAVAAAGDEGVTHCTLRYPYPTMVVEAKEPWPKVLKRQRNKSSVSVMDGPEPPPREIFYRMLAPSEQSRAAGCERVGCSGNRSCGPGGWMGDSRDLDTVRAYADSGNLIVERSDSRSLWLPWCVVIKGHLKIPNASFFSTFLGGVRKF